MPRAKIDFTKITTIYEEKVANSVKHRQMNKIDNNSLHLITNIVDDMRTHIGEVLREGVSEGRSVAATASKLLTTGLDKGVFRSARKRAWLIARTELHRARQQAAYDIYEANGIDKVKWIAIGDEKTCDLCLPRNNHTYNLTDIKNEDPIPAHPQCRCRLVPSDFKMSINVKPSKKGKILETKISFNPQDYKYIIKLNKSNYEYSSTQVEIPNLNRDIQKVISKIDPNDIHPTEKNDKPHITILYGLLTDDAKAIENALEYVETIKASLSNIDVFQPKERDYDVLIFRVDSPDLWNLNYNLGLMFEHENDFAGYQPHLTICYLKRDSGKKYINMVTGLEGKELEFSNIIFSPTNGNKVSIDLDESSILEKAKPYTRTRKGKLERVKGYKSKERVLVPEAPVFWPEELWKDLSGSERIRLTKIYKSSSQVWEGYTIGQHTKMVIDQFDKYFKNEAFSYLSDNVNGMFGSKVMRLLLAIHDIGKYDAIEREGDKNVQMKYDPIEVEHIFSQLFINDNVIAVAKALVSQDNIGEYLKDPRILAGGVAKKFNALAKKANIPLEEFYKLAKVYFMCDAGSYTKDAGGKPSLDYLFNFNHFKEPFGKWPMNTMEFASPASLRIAVLDSVIKNYKEEYKTSLTFYHGTAGKYLTEIIKKGIVSKKYHNFSKTLYEKGERKDKVFVAENVSDAAFFAETASTETRRIDISNPAYKTPTSDEYAPVILKIKVPAIYFDQQAVPDSEWMVGPAWMFPTIRPEWIEAAAIVNQNWKTIVPPSLETKTSDEVNDHIFNSFMIMYEKLRKAKNEFLTIYMPTSMKNFSKIIEDFEKSVQVKGFLRAKKGKLETVRPYMKTIASMAKEMVVDKKLTAKKYKVDPSVLEYSGLQSFVPYRNYYKHLWTIILPGHELDQSTVTSPKNYKIPTKVEKSEDLEKAKPYVRIKRGKLEHVKGYPHRPRLWNLTPAQRVERALEPYREDVKVAHRVSQEVAAYGGRALIVGGFVRDAIMGKPSKDIDIEVYGIRSDELRAILEGIGKVDNVGASFGVFKISTPEIEEAVDVTIPRRESKIGEGHKDFEVEGDPSMNVKEAARRRDLTINSISYDPVLKTIIDEYNGIQDIEDRKLRVVDPNTFVEDPLRVLRVMQFAGRFEMSPDVELIKLCRTIDLKSLPKERLYSEFEKLFLKSKMPSIGLRLIPALGIDKIFPELQGLRGIPQDKEWHPEGNVWRHTLLVTDAAARKRKLFENKQDKMVLMLAALCHDMGKPGTTGTNEEGRIISHGHDEAGVEVAGKFLDKLSNETELIERVKLLVGLHMAPTNLYDGKAGNSGIRRLARKVDIPMLIAVSIADKEGREIKADLTAERWLLQKYKSLKLTDPKTLEAKVLGRHLIPLGIQPGKGMGQILKQIYEGQLEGQFDTTEGGLDYARELGLIEKSQVKEYFRSKKGKLERVKTHIKNEIKDLQDEMEEKAPLLHTSYDRLADGSRAKPSTKKIDPDTEASIKRWLSKSTFILDKEKARKGLVALKKSHIIGKKIPYRKYDGKVTWAKVANDGFIVKSVNQPVDYNTRILIKSDVARVTGIGKDGVIARTEDGQKHEILYKDLNYFLMNK